MLANTQPREVPDIMQQINFLMYWVRVGFHFLCIVKKRIPRKKLPIKADGLIKASMTIESLGYWKAADSLTTVSSGLSIGN